jgi:hypothetical protein
MSAVGLSFSIFVLILGGIFLGMLLRRFLPIQHLTKDSQDTVRLGVGLIATISGLVLGLLIAAAKNSYDTKSSQVTQMTANVILLDTILARYGSEAGPIRQQMRGAVGPFVDRIWHDNEISKGASFAPNAATEQAYVDIQALSPKNELQKALQARAAQVSTEIAQTRLLLFVEKNNSIPTPFLIILVFWLVIIFASFSLFAEMNATVLAALCTFALSASGAIFLILELDDPFTGLMSISSAPLRNALGALSS